MINDDTLIHNDTNSTIKTILIDMDDTVEDLLDTWIKWLNNLFGYSLKKEDITDYHLENFYTTLTNEQIHYPLSQALFWKEVKPKPDAYKYLKMLQEDGYELYIVTRSHYATLFNKFEYCLKKYFKDIFDWSHIIVCANKQMIKGDVLIDDYPKNLLSGNYKKLLFDSPTNKTFNEEAHDIIRVHNWEEIYNIIKRLN